MSHPAIATERRAIAFWWAFPTREAVSRPKTASLERVGEGVAVTVRAPSPAS